MKVVYAPKDEEAVVGLKIILNGEYLGWMRKGESSSKCHCGFEFNAPVGGISLIQGFGETEEEAINDAISKAEKNAADFMTNIGILKGKLSL